MTKKQKNNKEISVSAPDYIPKREPVLKDTTGTEALDVFKVAKILSRVSSVILVIFSIFVVILSASDIFLSSNIFLNPLFIGILGLLGTMNIFCGLILLAKK